MAKKKVSTKAADLALLGNNPMSIIQGTTATDPGATSSATPVTSDWATVVDTNVIGSYTVTYTDADTDTITRTVEVVAQATAGYPSTPFADGDKSIGGAVGYIDTTSATEYKQTVTDAKAGNPTPEKDNSNQAAYFSDSALDPYEQAHATDS
jgi:hypothetical protein